MQRRLLYGQVGEENFDLRDSHVFGVLQVVEEDKVLGPEDVGLFGTNRAVFDPGSVTNPIQ